MAPNVWRTVACVVVLVGVWGGVAESNERRARQTSFPQNDPRCPAGNNCINLLDCPTLAPLLNRRPRPSREDINTLRRALCGFTSRRQPLACCPTGIGLPTQPTIPPTVPTQPTIAPGNGGGEALLPSSCGTTRLSDNIRIFGGKNAIIGSYPWMALLGFTSRSQPQVVFGCGGALINDRYVLTAGHCTSPEFTFNRDLTMIRLGEHDLSTEGDCQTSPSGVVCAPVHQTFSPAEIIPHPTFNRRGTIGDDLALIRLDRPAIFNNFVRPVCLPSADHDTETFLGGRMATVSGWGVTEKGPDTQILQKVILPFVNQDECNPHFNNGLLQEQICFGGDGPRDSCFGDSGGPIVGMIANSPISVLLGMVSFGQPSCGVAGVPAVYTNVASYRPWILSNLKP